MCNCHFKLCFLDIYTLFKRVFWLCCNVKAVKALPELFCAVFRCILLRSAGHLQHFLLINVILKKSSTMFFSFKSEQTVSFLVSCAELLVLCCLVTWTSLILNELLSWCLLKPVTTRFDFEEVSMKLTVSSCDYTHTYSSLLSSNSPESRRDRYVYAWLDFPECDLTPRWLLTLLCLLNCPSIHDVWPYGL